MPPMSPPPPSLSHILLLILFLSSGGGASGSSCGGGAESCGELVLPFPFHLNSSSSCTAGADANSSSLFRLSCVNATLTFPLGGATFRVLDFLPDGTSLLLDYAAPVAAPCDPSYGAFSRPSSPAAALDGAAPFLAVSPNNVLRLYACDDSSLCRAGCDDVAAACDGKNNTSPGCCYPLSDGSVWKPGDGLALFTGFGCRGFSSWVKNRSSSSPTGSVTRGIEVEWAVPRGSALAACAGGASPVNATTVRGGVRCLCPPGLVGDGFERGTGCSKRLECGRECCEGRFCSKKAVALAGFFVSVFFLAAAASFWLLLRQPSPSSGDTTRRWDLDPACIPKILGGVCNARQFTYEELDAAKRRFDDGNEKATDAVHGGVLDDGAVVAVQRVGYETQDKLRQTLDAVSLLPEVSHRNVARVVGFCLLDPVARAVLLVHESSAGGTLEDHLRRTATGGRASLGWHHRVNIAIELASALAYLQAHDSFLHDLRSSDVFLDADLTAKIAGHKLVSSTAACYHYHYYYGSSPAAREQDVVCNFGLLLIELLTGLRHQHPFDSVASKLREGRLHEVIDPTLLLASSSSSGRNQQLPATAEEVRRVLELAVRCLLSAENGMGMAAAARELVHVARFDGGDMGSSSKIEISLEETFSSSSLLQMISMSPDTLHRHLP